MEIKRCLFGKTREPAGQSWLPLEAVIPLAPSDNRSDFGRQ
jgi:hypothetical protein